MKIFYYLNLGSIFALGLLSFYSPLRALDIFNPLWSFFILLWIVSAFLFRPGFFVKPNGYHKLLYLYLLYSIGIPFLTANSSIGFRYFELSQIYIFLMASNYNISLGANKNNIKIILALIPFVLLTSVITLRAYLINPISSRLIKESLGGGLHYLQSGIGGYHYIYFIVILFAVLIYLYRNGPNKHKMYYNSSIGFIILILGINIIYSNYSTALLLIFISLISRAIFVKIRTDRIPQYFQKIFVLLILAYALLLPLIDFGIYYLSGSVNSERLLEIRYLISAQEMGSSMYSRADAYIKSIQVFFEHPMTGVIFDDLAYQSGGVTGFGQHSFILDTYALYGFIFGTLNIYLLSSPLLARIKSTNPHASGFAANMFIIFLMLSLINNMTPSIGFAAFFVFPSIYKTFFNSYKPDSGNSNAMRSGDYLIQE
jgi:hypothetical protein